MQRLIQKHGIKTHGKHKFRVTKTDSKHNLPIAPNVLDRNFPVAAPNLAVVIDLFSRKVVGWSMRPDIQRSLVIDALELAWLARNPGKKAGLLFHSDRGSQYASEDFAKVLEHCSITPSTSRLWKSRKP